MIKQTENTWKFEKKKFTKSWEGLHKIRDSGKNIGKGQEKCNKDLKQNLRKIEEKAQESFGKRYENVKRKFRKDLEKVQK